MRVWFIVFLGLFLLQTSVSAFETQVLRSEKEVVELLITPESRDLTFEKIAMNGMPFVKLNQGNGMNQDRIGQPDLPRIHRWVAVPKDVKAKVTHECEDTAKFDEILAYPVQPDTIDNGSKAPFTFLKDSYEQDGWTDAIGAKLAPVSHLGQSAILPVTVIPMQYNAKTKEAKLCKKLRIKVEMKSSSNAKEGPVSSFTRQQLKALTVNGREFLRRTESREVAPNYLIVSQPAFGDYAKRIASLSSHSGGKAFTAVITAGAKPEDVKKVLQSQFRDRKIDAILILGDTKQIPFFQHNKYIPGDAFYSFLSGDDEVADVALGRIPVSNEAEAKIIVKKIEHYRGLKAEGHFKKNVMLLAHRENYPEKYTANMNSVKALPNTKNFSYTLQYGGEKANNDSVLNEASRGYSIINYRGHGSETSWYEWGSDDKSFGLEEAEKFAELENDNAFIFNICCDSGDIEHESGSLAKKQLFPNLSGNSLKGAIGTIGSTEPSWTEVNHRFNLHLFEHLQNGEKLTIGNLYALANNQLVQENGGKTAPENVLMYVLYSDPTLVPLIE
jgi:hypothetical protein